MLFNSYEFIFIFFPVTLGGFWILSTAGKGRAAVAWLVAASLVYYGWWNVNYLWLIVFSLSFNFLIGRALTSLPQPDRRRNAWLTVGVVANLALLGYYKYAGFFVGVIEAMSGADWNWPSVVLPIAISFFTFQQIAYLVDAHAGKASEYRFLNYCLFVTFFPQLIAGPIVHHGEMMPQFAKLDARRAAMLRNLALGTAIFSIGLFKKVVLADGISEYADPVFSAAANDVPLTLFEAWSGALAYTFQLYFDFSGYSDMAIGLAHTFGIRLPLNFDSPYKADNIIEFWRRWHMTLSRFLRDYLYFPLGGNRRGPARRYVNLFVTMLLGGLWHGAGWTFVAWGALHGLFLIINHAWRRLFNGRRRRPEDSSVPGKVLGRGLTFLAVVCAWVVFRADNFTAALNVFEGMAGINGVALRAHYFGLLGPLAPILAAAGVQFEEQLMMVGSRAGAGMLFMLAVVWFAPNTQQIMLRYRPAVGRYAGEVSRGRWRAVEWRPTAYWAVCIAGLAVVAVVFANRVNAFLYYQF